MRIAFLDGQLQQTAETLARLRRRKARLVQELLELDGQIMETQQYSDSLRGKILEEARSVQSSLDVYYYPRLNFEQGRRR